jgi:hypothetical protein
VRLSWPGWPFRIELTIGLVVGPIREDGGTISDGAHLEVSHHESANDQPLSLTGR